MTLECCCDQILERLAPLLAAAQGRPVLAALDGCCGSGKTTLAALLARRMEGRCTLLHTDDYYLPPDRRAPNWAETPAANMDLVRLREEALAPARAGQPFAARAYSCREGQYLPPVPLVPGALVLVEGSYSHHPLLAPYYGLRVFLQCSPAEQARRLQAREGARWPLFAQRWIPLEEGYFAQYDIPQRADLVLRTDPEQPL